MSKSTSETLEALIAPGRRMRLSPMVQAAQAKVIFGRSIDPACREENWRQVLSENASVVRQLAEEWLRHVVDGGTSYAHIYDGAKSIFQAALVEHASRFIPQVQLVLVDLFRQGLLSEDFAVAILSESAGVGAEAVLDFLCALHDVCDLFSLPRLTTSIRFVCSVPNEPARLANAAFLAAFCRHLEEIGYADSFPKWAELSIDWIEGPMRSVVFPTGFRATLAIAGPVLDDSNELGDFEEQLRSNLAEAIVIVHEPGTKERARGLMRWRKDFLERAREYRSLGPCGMEFGHTLPEACLTCSPIRREDFHTTPLHKAFNDELERAVKANRIAESLPVQPLSWSYVALTSAPSGEIKPSFVPLKFNPGQQITEPVSLRYMGTRGKQGEPVQEHPDSFSETDSSSFEWINLCPAYAAVERLVIKRTAGKQVAPFRYGESFQIAGLVTTQSSDPRQVVLELDKEPQFSQQRSSAADSPFLPMYNPATDPQTRKAIDRIAHRLFGFVGMRDFQHDVLAQVLTGKDILAIAATGGGKSECFILPAMILPGVTVVVSPLKSLMADQLQQRLSKRYGLGNLCTLINGDVPLRERQARLKRMEMGFYKLVYVTPEQLERAYVLESLRRTNEGIGVRYIALDEAHCISQWGHDFRPSYLNIVRRLKDRGICPARIALTATASPNVRQDVCDELGLANAPPPDGNVLVVSSNRPELNLIVRVRKNAGQKADGILEDLRKLLRDKKRSADPGSAIVFMPLTGGDPDETDHYPRENPWGSQAGRFSAGVTRFASYVERRLQSRIAIYHGKMGEDADVTDQDADSEPAEALDKPLGDLTGRTRSTQQNSFISGEREIMVATKGFGMGIDKPNIRLVIHRSPTANLEAYAQESGRAGRDGRPADVILYYSPDRAEDEYASGTGRSRERSDHQIQADFITGRYARRIDVQVMRAFLKTVSRATGTKRERLYFTGDEALRFFEDCSQSPALAGLSDAYEWPEFPPFEPSSKWSEEFRRIRQRGQEYQNKTRYIDRVLAVLHRIRPECGSLGPRAAFLESMLKVDAAIRGLKRFDTAQILGSNVYFGDVLRSRHVSGKELESFLKEGVATDLIPFARRLETPLAEVMQMLADIKFCDGQVTADGRWESFLLDASFITPKYWPPNATDPRVWRDYAGAWRAKPPDRTRGQYPSIDDWFPEWTINKPIGWEVLPGPAFHADDEFDAYLDVFMRLHDQRQDNDWAAFYRLLTDYVGVNADGSVPDKRARGKCLRSVLLGYLRTNEVVVGGNCFSCNVCVEEKDFDSYSVEQRIAAVVRMSQRMQAELDAVEQLAATAPTAKQLDQFFEQVNEEEATGRSLKGYVAGWSAGLLDQIPDHRGVLWLRLAAVSLGVLEIHAHELVMNARQILASSTAPEEIARLSSLLHILDVVDRSQDIEFIRLRADVSEREGNAQAQLDILERLLTRDLPEDVELEVRQKLIELSASDGRLPDQKRHAHHSVESGWLSTSWNVALDYFLHGQLPTSWPGISQMIDNARRTENWDRNRGALIWAWLTWNPPAQEDQRNGVRYLLEDVSQFWQEISPSTFGELIDRVGDEPFVGSPEALRKVVKMLGPRSAREMRVRASRLLLNAAARQGLTLDEDESVQLLKDLFNNPTIIPDETDCVSVARSENAHLVAAQLLPQFRPAGIASLVVWVQYFPSEVHLRGNAHLAMDFLIHSETVIVRSHIDVRKVNRLLLDSLRTLRNDLLARPEMCDQASRSWSRIAELSPEEQTDHWRDSLETLGDDAVVGAAGDLFESGEPNRIGTFIALLAEKRRNRAAAKLLARHKPLNLATLANWINSFPPQSMVCGDGQLALEFLACVQHIVVAQRINVFEIEYGLLKSLRDLVGLLLKREELATQSHDCWSRIVERSPRERLNYLLMCLKEQLRRPDEVEADLGQLLRGSGDPTLLFYAKLALKSESDSAIREVLIRVLAP